MKRKSVALRVIIGTAILGVLLFLCAVASAALSYPFTTTVTTTSVNIRRSASSSAVIMEQINPSSSIEVVGASGNYYKVRHGTTTGYILKNFVVTDAASIVTPTPIPVETVTGYPYETVTLDSVNLRAKKSTKSALLRQIPKGATVTVKANSGTWAEVDYGKYSGYVKNEYIVVKQVVKATATPKPTGTPDPIADASGYQVLKSGSEGRDVKALQMALIELGFMNGNADGKFGVATEYAVTCFQSGNSYPATGVVDANLQAFLYSGKPKNAAGTATKIKTLAPLDGVTVRSGNIGEQVGELQQKLRELGFYTGEISNTCDSETMKAVKAFQKANGLKSDGICGADTWRVLWNGGIGPNVTATAAPTPTPTPVPTWKIPSQTVKKNSVGADVKLVQKRLKELGYYKGSVDGKFGTASVKALKAFQTAHYLEADGKAGKNTYAVLFTSNAVPAGATATPRPTQEATPSPVPTDVPTEVIQTPVVYETLRQGNSGESVYKLQNALISLGYLEGGSDGVYGAKTTLAVRDFQKNNNLSADGAAGNNTLTLLYSGNAKSASTKKATATPSKATPAPSSSLRQGDRNNAVKEMQQILISMGYLSGKADGIFGLQTYQAVVAFQKNNKLTADGIAGTKTLNQMNSSAAVPANGSKPTATPVPTAPVNSKPRASQVIYANWYDTVKAVAKKYPYVTIYDYATGISWQEHIFSMGAHADAEPLTAADTAKMEKVFGGNTWNPRAVWVIFADGSVYMASTHSMPHEVQHIRDNNFDGHLCIHFPRTQKQVEAIGPYATSHQATIDAGWAATQSMK